MREHLSSRSISRMPEREKENIDLINFHFSIFEDLNLIVFVVPNNSFFNNRDMRVKQSCLSKWYHLFHERQQIYQMQYQQ